MLVPRYLATDLVLAVSDEQAVVLHGIACYPSGFAFSLETLSRFETDEDDYRDEPLELYRRGGTNDQDRLLRFGIEYSNGKRTTSLDSEHFGAWPRSSDDDAPHVASGGGGGGGGSWSYDFWVWPLPPPGPVIFAVEWPAYGIAETQRRIKGERFRAAADKSKPVFPEP